MYAQQAEVLNQDNKEIHENLKRDNQKIEELKLLSKKFVSNISSKHQKDFMKAVKNNNFEVVFNMLNKDESLVNLVDAVG